MSRGAGGCGMRPILQSLSLDGFRMSVGRSSSATWTFEGARDFEGGA